MKWFYNLRISAKLLSAFIVMALITALVGYIGLSDLQIIIDADARMYKNVAIPTSQIGQISTMFQRIRVNTRDIVLTKNLKEKEQYGSLIQTYRGEIDKIAQEYEKSITDQETKQIFEQFKVARVEYGNDLDVLINLAKSNKDVEALNLLKGEMRKSADAEMALIDKMDSLEIAEAKTLADQNTATGNSSTRNMLLIVVIAVLTAIGLGLFISRIISRPVNQMSEAAEKIAAGDLNINIDIATTDEIGTLANSFRGIIETLRALIAEAMMLTQAAVSGQLATRGHAEKFKGGYKEIVEGVNETLDAVIGPLNVAAEYMDRISKGDIPQKITDNYKGDFNEIKNNLNICIEAVGALVADANMLAQAAAEGQLATRADASKHGGDFRRIVEGVNNTLDAVIGPLNVAAEYVDRISKGDIPPKITDNYKGDFNEIKNNLNTCIDAVNALVADANMLANAAVEGKLVIRADASKHGGDFKRIINGVNSTLDAVVEPINEALTVLQEIVKGNLQVHVAGNYQGSHAELKDALNATITNIAGYITEMSAVLTEMSEGNLNVGITREYLGDFTVMKESLNMIIGSFNGVLGDMNVAAHEVAAGARQLSDSSQALSQGSTEQASSIEQLTTSMTEIAEQTKQNAVNANQANDLAMVAKDNAVKGNNQMQEMLKSMDEINEASANISKIIKVVDEIAFQTNILALNAAVEAARAGQLGKGFAVVADEVRNLAARSANAAKETAAMIEGSIRKAEDGTKIANETAEALNQIVDGISQSADLVSSIANASNEQATAIVQVNQGINQVAQVTQNNSATAEESASASEELSSQAEHLQNMVARFQLKNASIRNQGYEAKVSGDDYIGNKAATKKGIALSRAEAAASKASASKGAASKAKSAKAKISLSDTEFDKY